MFLTNFLKNLSLIIDVEIVEIVWCYGVSQLLHDELSDQISVPIRFFEGVPRVDDINSIKKGPKIIVLDDLMGKYAKQCVELFTVGSHHFSWSIFNLIQNIFHQSKGSRDMSLNSHYIVFFKNPRDRLQIAHFGRQMYPEDSKFVAEAYADATKRPHGYLVF